jgi:hypothetical protein
MLILRLILFIEARVPILSLPQGLLLISVYTTNIWRCNVFFWLWFYPWHTQSTVLQCVCENFTWQSLWEPLTLSSLLDYVLLTALKSSPVWIMQQVQKTLRVLHVECVQLASHRAENIVREQVLRSVSSGPSCVYICSLFLGHTTTHSFSLKSQSSVPFLPCFHFLKERRGVRVDTRQNMIMYPRTQELANEKGGKDSCCAH